VVQPKPEEVKKFYKPGDWNEMVVSAHGRWIVVHVTEQRPRSCATIPAARKAYLASSFTGGQEMHVMFKDIRSCGCPRECREVAKKP